MAVKIELRHLRAFLELAEQKHFTRAAQRLFLTQSSLTQTVQQLEQALGVRLFDRSTRSVLLSAAGEALLPFARETMAQLEQFETAAARIARAESGRLVVGYQLGTGLDVVPEVLRTFEEKNPHVSIVLKEYDFGHPSTGLDVGETDIAFLRPPIDFAGVTLMTLYHEARIACVPKDHPLAPRGSVTIDEILAEPIIAAPGSGVWRDYWILDDYRVSPAIIAGESATFDQELQAVAAGRGIIVTCEASRTFYSRPGVVFLDIEGLSPCDVALAWPATSVNPAVAAFVATARAFVTTH